MVDRVPNTEEMFQDAVLEALSMRQDKGMSGERVREPRGRGYHLLGVPLLNEVVMISVFQIV